MEWESDSPCPSHTHPRQGHRSHRRDSSWDLDFVDCGAMPGRGLLLTTERRTDGMWGRRSEWEMPVEEHQALWKQGDTAGPIIVGGAITIVSFSPCTSIGSWTIDRMVNQVPDLLICRLGPHSGAPSMCLMLQTTEKYPRQGSPLSAWKSGAMEEEWQKRPPYHQLQEAGETHW